MPFELVNEPFDKLLASLNINRLLAVVPSIPHVLQSLTCRTKNSAHAQQRTTTCYYRTSDQARIDLRVIWDQPASRTRRMGPPNTDRRSSQFAILFSDISKVPEILQLHANERHQSEAGIQYSFNQKECYRASAFPSYVISHSGYLFNIITKIIQQSQSST